MKRLFTLSFAIALFFGLNAQTVVDPGFGNLKAAIDAAEDGDVLLLKNGEQYDEIETININKTLTIKAEEIALLPGLEGMPKVFNFQTVTPFIQLQDGGDLTIEGIEIDGNGASNIFSGRNDAGVVAFEAHRCRLHNTTSDIFQEFVEGAGTRVARMIVKNSFVYDAGNGHGIYARMFVGPTDPVVFENITYWNIGQQFTWIRITPNEEQDTHEFVFNHLTGYNLSTSTTDPKELFGNGDDDIRDANYVITLTNSIFHTQVETGEPASLHFNNNSGRHTITLENIYLWNCRPMDNAGTITENNIFEDVDPQFADPDNGDFTVANTDLYSAGTDGKIVGAVYWHPEYCDPLDPECEGENGSTNSVSSQITDSYNLRVYPNPVSSNHSLTVSFSLDRPETIGFEVYSINGQKVMEVPSVRMNIGENSINVSTDNLATGIYFGRLQTSKGTQSIKISVQ